MWETVEAVAVSTWSQHLTVLLCCCTLVLVLSLGDLNYNIGCDDFRCWCSSTRKMLVDLFTVSLKMREGNWEHLKVLHP